MSTDSFSSGEGRLGATFLKTLFWFCTAALLAQLLGAVWHTFAFSTRVGVGVLLMPDALPVTNEPLQCYTLCVLKQYCCKPARPKASFTMVERYWN